MQRGDIILYKGTGVVAWLIRRITKSRWNHVAWILSDSSVLESDSSTGGVVKTPLSFYINPTNSLKNRVKIVRPTHLSEGELNKSICIALEKLGHKYDYASILFLTWRYFLGFFRIKIRVSQIKKNRDTCVELIALPLLLVAGWRTHKNNNVNETVPGDFDTSPYTKDVK